MVEYSAGTIVFYRGKNEIAYLLLQHDPNDLALKRGKDLPDEYWNFPKGHLEGTETAVEAALRELEEEAGIKNSTLVPGFEEQESYELVLKDGVTKKTKYVTWFIAESPSQTVTISHEHIRFIWLPYDKALLRATHESTKRVLQKAHQFISV